MRTFGKTMVVWAVVLFTAVDPASACRFRARRCWRPRCQVRCVPCPPVNCSTGPSGVIHTGPEQVPSPPPIRGGAPPTPATPAPVPAAPKPAPQPAPVAPAPAAPAPSAPSTFEPSPSDTTTPVAPPPVEPPAAFEPALPETTAPVEPAAPAAPDAEVEDLFKDNDMPAAPAEEAPAKPAEPADSVEDLFKDTSNGSDKDFTPVGSDDEPAPAEAASEAPEMVEEPKADAKDDEIENLFEDPAAESPMNTAADEKPMNADPEPASDADEADKLFDDSAATEAPGSMRLWIDNTGKFRVTARLVKVNSDSVRLLKDNGKFTTVPMSRLSQADLAFVRKHAERVLVANF